MNTSSFFGSNFGDSPARGGGQLPERGWFSGGGGVGEGPGWCFSGEDGVEERRRGVAGRVLEWMGDWPHLRARWHRVIDGLPRVCAGGVPGELDSLLREVADFRLQFPFGLGPERAAEALLVQDRVSVLYSELVDLRVLLAHRNW